MASAHSFVAGPELPPVPFVVRVSETPPTESVVLALTTVVPAVVFVSVIVQLPVPPDVVHGFGVPSVPGPDAIEKVICVPSGAFAVPPLPLSTFTCAVKVWVAPTGFVAVSGEIWMFASTNVFTASDEFPFWPFVCTVTWTPPANVIVDVACPVTFPADGELNVIVH